MSTVSFDLICSECRKELKTEYMGSMVFKVYPCICQAPEVKPIVMDYEDLIAIVEDKVEVEYYKKNGVLRMLVGFLGVPHETISDLVYFVERENGSVEPQVKCLCRSGIARILQVDTGIEFHIKEGRRF